MLGECGATRAGHGDPSAAVGDGMKRKRNINFGFLPAHPTRADLRKSRGEFKAAVREKRRQLRAEYSRLRKAARSGRTQQTRKLEQLFHEVYGREQNPRILPEMTDEQLAAIEKLIKGKTMAQKKRESKKKKSGKMPAGLAAYWARKRRAKAKRRNPKRRRRNSRTSSKATRRQKASAERRAMTRVRKLMRSQPDVYGWPATGPQRKKKRRNPWRRVKRTPTRITLKGFTASQIKTVASVVRRATGKRVRVVKP